MLAQQEVVNVLKGSLDYKIGLHDVPTPPAALAFPHAHNENSRRRVFQEFRAHARSCAPASLAPNSGGRGAVRDGCHASLIPFASACLGSVDLGNDPS